MIIGGNNPLRGALNGATAQNVNAQQIAQPGFQGLQTTGGGGMIGGVTQQALGGAAAQPAQAAPPMPAGGPQRQAIQPQSMLGPNPGQQQMNPQLMQFLQMLMGQRQQGYQQQGPQQPQWASGYQQGYNPQQSYMPQGNQQSLMGGMNTQQYRMPQQYYTGGGYQQQQMPFGLGGPQMSQYSPMSGMYGNSRNQFSNPYQQGYMRGY